MEKNKLTINDCINDNPYDFNYKKIENNTLLNKTKNLDKIENNGVLRLDLLKKKIKKTAHSNKNNNLHVSNKILNNITLVSDEIIDLNDIKYYTFPYSKNIDIVQKKEQSNLFDLYNYYGNALRDVFANYKKSVSKYRNLQKENDIINIHTVNDQIETFDSSWFYINLTLINGKNTVICFEDVISCDFEMKRILKECDIMYYIKNSSINNNNNVNNTNSINKDNLNEKILQDNNEEIKNTRNINPQENKIIISDSHNMVLDTLLNIRKYVKNIPFIISRNMFEFSMLQTFKLNKNKVKIIKKLKDKKTPTLLNNSAVKENNIISNKIYVYKTSGYVYTAHIEKYKKYMQKFI
ncbi:hypothetical protein EHP00_779 [Ecytonucleospora hepatopenaei]|uniref:Uncharacterized protein n=1 Tax=Ecytonucleospora hepatopenaei TaxID=646526 RepID=A0A1W0E7S2_9MICR|nr:hypothetical protein EHP00_779 [Ecytonucleospora hepatopenaei]